MMELSLLDMLARLIIGLVIGFNIGLTGIGGGVLAVPALTLLLHEDTSFAVGTAAAYAFLTKLVAAWRHYRLKHVDMHSTLFILLGAVPGTILVAILMNHLMESRDVGPFISQLLAWSILLSACLMLANFIRRGRVPANQLTLLARFVTAKRGRERTAMIIVGILLGALIASTSMHGVFTVVMMVMVLGMEARKTVGSSIMVAVVLTFLTAVIYGTGSHVHWMTALIMSLGSVIGVWSGSHLSARVPERKLRAVVIVVIFLAGFSMLAKAIG
jgi:uncharacterized membrane protein YfcA